MCGQYCDTKRRVQSAAREIKKFFVFSVDGEIATEILSLSWEFYLTTFGATTRDIFLTLLYIKNSMMNFN